MQKISTNYLLTDVTNCSHPTLRVSIVYCVYLFSNTKLSWTKFTVYIYIYSQTKNSPSEQSVLCISILKHKTLLNKVYCVHIYLFSNTKLSWPKFTVYIYIYSQTKNSPSEQSVLCISILVHKTPLNKVYGISQFSYKNSPKQSVLCISILKHKTLQNKVYCGSLFLNTNSPKQSVLWISILIHKTLINQVYCEHIYISILVHKTLLQNKVYCASLFSYTKLSLRNCTVYLYFQTQNSPKHSSLCTVYHVYSIHVPCTCI